MSPTPDRQLASRPYLWECERVHVCRLGLEIAASSASDALTRSWCLQVRERILLLRLQVSLALAPFSVLHSKVCLRISSLQRLCRALILVPPVHQSACQFSHGLAWTPGESSCFVLLRNGQRFPFVPSLCWYHARCRATSAPHQSTRLIGMYATGNSCLFS